MWKSAKSIVVVSLVCVVLVASFFAGRGSGRRLFAEQIDELEVTVNDLSERLRAANTTIEDLGDTVGDLESSQQRDADTIGKLTKSSEHLGNLVDRQKRIIDEIARANSEAGNTSSGITKGLRDTGLEVDAIIRYIQTRKDQDGVD